MLCFFGMNAPNEFFNSYACSRRNNLLNARKAASRAALVLQWPTGYGM
jgi:hypothetical protein